MKFFVPIQKVDAAKRLVYGRATDETPDLSGEVFDYATSVPHFKAWSGELEKLTGGKSKGNVRAMHGKVAAGLLTEIDFDDAAKAIDVCAHIVDDAEWEKVEKGVYTGFSIGGSYEKRWNDPENPTLKRYTAIPSEISIVDLACNPNAAFDMIKADGMIEKVAFVKSDEPEVPAAPNAPAPDLEQVWKAADGKTFKLKADAQAHNDEIKKAAEAAEALAGQPGDEAVVVDPVVEPAPVDKNAGGDLAKGMYGVSDFASILSNLRWLAEDSAREAVNEGDGSTVPAALKDWLVAGVKIFISMATEEAKELVGGDDDDELDFDGVIELAAKVEGLAKGGKGSSQVIHDHAVKMGAKCSTSKSAAEGDLAKAASDLEKMTAERDGFKAEYDVILKSVPDKFGEVGKPLSAAVEKMVKRLEALEALPAAGGPLSHVFAVSKALDGLVEESDAERIAREDAAIAKMDPEAKALALIKRAQGQPLKL